MGKVGEGFGGMEGVLRGLIEESVENVLERLGLADIVEKLELLDRLMGVGGDTMSHKQAALYLNKSNDWLYRHKEVPRHYIEGHGVVYFRDELDQYTESLKAGQAKNTGLKNPKPRTKKIGNSNKIEKLRL